MPVPTSDLQRGEAPTFAIPTDKSACLTTIQYDWSCPCRCYPADAGIYTGESVERGWALLARDLGNSKATGSPAEVTSSKVCLILFVCAIHTKFTFCRPSFERTPILPHRCTSNTLLAEFIFIHLFLCCFPLHYCITFG
jgi:hypothetical protein